MRRYRKILPVALLLAAASVSADVTAHHKLELRMFMNLFTISDEPIVAVSSGCLRQDSRMTMTGPTISSATLPPPTAMIGCMDRETIQVLKPTLGTSHEFPFRDAAQALQAAHTLGGPTSTGTIKMPEIKLPRFRFKRTGEKRMVSRFQCEEYAARGRIALDMNEFSADLLPRGRARSHAGRAHGGAPAL
jgi:hypothetical protein